jgi:hypothetical protein
MSYEASKSTSSIGGRFKFIPLRLDEEERRYLSILENALEVCEYTDVVDVTFSHLRTSKQSRMMTSLIDLLSIKCGLMMSNDLGKGEALFEGRSLDDNVPLFARIFEIGRRYKIMNPNKMRDTYGKLMYMCMDTQTLDLRQNGKKLNFVNPIKTVYSFLQGTGCEEIMLDPLLEEATLVMEDDFISSVDEAELEMGVARSPRKLAAEESELLKGKRAKLAERSRSKAAAAAALIRKYATSGSETAAEAGAKTAMEDAEESATPAPAQRRTLSAADVERVIASVADNATFLSFNVGPVTRMLEMLTSNFVPDSIREPFSLELSGQPRKAASYSYSSSPSWSSYYSGYSSKYFGKGACLSHDHRTQYTFVKQSLMLWTEIMRYMPRLWIYADQDMLEQPYRLADTGQGYQRVQQCPFVSKCMNAILSNVKSKCPEAWVGLSVVHLGDRDVPNALVFIDKYTQVPRILTPITQCILRIPMVLAQDRAFHHYVREEWKSMEGLRLQILSDFFKHGFDGSGDDGGSCIDGRLTSTWNWCSKLHKKPYYHVFMFTGFQGFDGSDWKQD